MRYICIISILTMFMLAGSSTSLSAQPRHSTKVTMQEIRLADDSLHISLNFDFDGIVINSTRKLVLTPFLRKGSRELALPPVVLTGKRRMLDDRRLWNVDSHSRPVPFPYSITRMPSRRKAWTGRKTYQAAVPYAVWMRHAELLLEERELNCCDNWLLALSLLDDNLDLPDPCRGQGLVMTPDTVYATEVQEEAVATVEPAEVPLCVECTVVYIEFAQSQYDVRAEFSHNRTELAKVDSVIAHLPKEKCVLHVCGYASPEGILLDNEILARNRTESFVAYLKRNYKLPPNCSIVTTSVGEDWEGLVKLLKQTGKPYAAPSLGIIENLGVLDGREKQLMDLQRGDPYRDMLETLFPYLRRIELRVRMTGGENEK